MAETKKTEETLCVIHCECGGQVGSLLNGVIYAVLDGIIIFRGKCDSCGGIVGVRRPIISLFDLGEEKVHES